MLGLPGARNDVSPWPIAGAEPCALKRDRTALSNSHPFLLFATKFGYPIGEAETHSSAAHRCVGGFKSFMRALCAHARPMNSIFLDRLVINDEPEIALPHGLFDWTERKLESLVLASDFWMNDGADDAHVGSPLRSL